MQTSLSSEARFDVDSDLNDDIDTDSDLDDGLDVDSDVDVGIDVTGTTHSSTRFRTRWLIA